MAPPNQTSIAGMRGASNRFPLPLDQLQRFNPNRPDAIEAIWQPFYDFQAMPTATAQMTFFAVPNGQGGKTINDTNMQLAGQFPAPTAFLCTAIMVCFIPGNTVSQALTATRALTNLLDVAAVCNVGSLNLTIGNKPYLTDAPVGKFPPNFTIGGLVAVSGVDSDLAVSSSIDANYARAQGRYYEITPLLIPQTQAFSITLQWATGPTLTSTGRIGVIMDGFYYRQSQ